MRFFLYQTPIILRNKIGVMCKTGIKNSPNFLKFWLQNDVFFKLK